MYLLTHTHTQYEAIPESLKNMLLVMSTQGIFDSATINSSQSDSSIRLSSKDASRQLLWQQTWNRIQKFLPNFLHELFPNVTPPISDLSPTHSGATPPPEVVVATQPLTVPRQQSPSGSPEMSPHSSPPQRNSPGKERRHVIVTDWKSVRPKLLKSSQYIAGKPIDAESVAQTLNRP